MTKVFRLAVLALSASLCSFGASKEIVELQRDVALLQDKMNTMQRTLDEKFGMLQALLQQQADSTSKTQAQMTNLEGSMQGSVSQSLRPLAGLNDKVNSMGDDIRSLQGALNDLNSRLERMDAKITDIGTKITVAQNPPPAPGAVTGTTPGQPGTGPSAGVPAGPPPGMSAERSYTDARRDLQTGNPVALKEFQDYLTYFPNTEQAPNAQYYIGQIYYTQGDYANAIAAFDAVLERFPENPKTADAHLMKGQALLKSGQRNAAVQEFRALIAKYPRTDDARQASYQLRQLGVSTSSGTSSGRRKQD